MGRKVIAFWLSMAMVLSFIVVLDVIIDFTPPVKGGIIRYVNETGTGGAYTKIQDAINASSDGDTIFVYNGTYYENVVVNKTINLTGNGENNTIIDGNGNSDVIKIRVDWVNITGFTINGSGLGSGKAGIELYIAENCSVFQNKLINNTMGIYILYSKANKIINNTLSNNEYGIYLSYSSNTTLLCNNASNNLYNIYCYHSNMSSIIGNIASSSEYYDGIYLDYSDDNNISENIVSSNFEYGIRLHYSNSNELNGNFINKNGGGILSYYSCWNNLVNNSMVEDGIVIAGNKIEFWNTLNIDTLNLANGKPVYYWKNQTDGLIPGGAGQVILANCTNVEILNQKITNVTMAIEIGFSSNNNITGNNASNNRNGIVLHHSNWNTVSGNIMLGNDKNCVYLLDSNMNNITNNTASTGNGFHLSYSNENNVSKNQISNKWCGIDVYYSYENTIGFNTVLSNRHGIRFYDSHLNSIIYNTVSSSDENGFYLYDSSNNSIYHNNIVNNANQAFDDRNDNYWDNGYPSGGNYWSDYDGIDLNSTPTQDVPPPDGKGDTPYIIDPDSQDNYPLMSPIGNCIFLREGWNLISLPFIQSDINLDAVLSSIRGKYDALQRYNASDYSDYWKHNSTKKPPNLNDLYSIDQTMGFWIHITKPGGVLFEYFGTQPTSNQTIQLYPGWNLVGYPSFTNYNRTEGLNNLTFGTDVDAIWTYDATTQKWKEIGPTDYFEIGRGYWVHAKTKCEWEVPW